MKRFTFALLSAAVSCVSLQAQATNPTIAEMKSAYTQVKTNLIKAAEKVPEADYAFKASPDIRSLGELFQHIAQAQVNYCGRVSGKTTPPDFGAKSKADIVSALKASFDNCDAAWESVTDANMSEAVGQGRMAGTRLGMLVRNAIHDNEEYGYISVYLRLKGIVPPSSEAPMPGRGGR